MAEISIYDAPSGGSGDEGNIKRGDIVAMARPDSEGHLPLDTKRARIDGKLFVPDHGTDDAHKRIVLDASGDVVFEKRGPAREVTFPLPAGETLATHFSCLFLFIGGVCIGAPPRAGWYGGSLNGASVRINDDLRTFTASSNYIQVFGLP